MNGGTRPSRTRCGAAPSTTIERKHGEHFVISTDSGLIAKGVAERVRLTLKIKAAGLATRTASRDWTRLGASAGP